MIDFEAPLLFLPLVGSFLAHAPVIRFDWFKALKHPLDGGATFRGRRVFGDNKSWRGALVMAGGALVCALLLSRWPWYWSRLPAPIQSAGPLVFGASSGLGMVLAELPGSFLKRQRGIAPGAQETHSTVGLLLSLWDQGDFVLGVWLVLAPVWKMPLRQAAFCFAVVAAVHLALSSIGFAIGARKTVL